ncbi:Alpha-L-arabinofuranosidase A [Paramyrothecium foliicola]|nr:Alpha-L-arabinofuranosidase A [Paramyrothecium foliicola]
MRRFADAKKLWQHSYMVSRFSDCTPTKKPIATQSEYEIMVRLNLILSLIAAVPVAVAKELTTGDNTDTVPGAYIIEFDDDQVIHSSNNQLDASQLRVQAATEYETRLELNYKLFNGVSIQLDIETAEKKAAQLASLPAVKNIWPVRVVPLPELIFEDNERSNRSATAESRNRKRQGGSKSPEHSNVVVDANSPHTMTQVDKLHAKGITGHGIRIAVIDTGIDYNHPALGGCFGDGCLVSFGHDLVGDGYDGFNTPSPDNDPLDTCSGHGTHVAGIIGARENEYGFTGAAPDAVLGAYRVFGCAGGNVGNDVLIAAFNKAYEDGADIITASIGGPSGWTQNPWSIAVSRIVAKGVPCILAAGNSGQFFSMEAAATGEGVTAVASFQNTMLPRELYAAHYMVNNGSSIAYPFDWGLPEWYNQEERPVWATSFDTENDNDACEPLPDDTPDLSNFDVLVRRGNCHYEVQARNIADKGGRYIIWYNNQPGTVWVDVEGGVDEIKGIIMVPPEVGKTWVEKLEAGSEIRNRMTWWINAGPFIIVQPNYQTPGYVSLFTSWGPTFEMNAKPQFGAPGGNILSTYPTERGLYRVASGTSMATPFVAAAYALIAEARGTLDPTTIENLLASNSNPQLFEDLMNYGSVKDWLAPPAQQGAGLIQVSDAAFAKTLLEPSALSFKDSNHFIETLNFTLTNTGDSNIIYEISHVPTHSLFMLNEDGNFVDIDGFKPPVDTPAHADLVFSESAVTISPGDSVTVQVSATPPQLDATRYPLWSGYIAVNGSDGTSLSIPYQGLIGSLENAVVLRESGAWVTSQSDWQLAPLPVDTVIALPPQGTDIASWFGNPPLLIIDLIWGTPLLIMEVVALESDEPASADGEVIGQLPGSPLPWFGRGQRRLFWSGALEEGGYAPAGRYKTVVRALRIGGDASVDADCYAELIRNRAFQGDQFTKSTLYPWTAFGPASISLSNTQPALSSALPTSVAVKAEKTEEIGLSNPGYWGIDVVPQTYTGTFWVLGAYAGDFTAALRSNKTSDIYASTIVPSKSKSGEWVEHEFTIVAETAAGHDTKFTLTYVPTSANQTLNFNFISLFPPTWKGRANGLRPDLMETIKDLNPSFFRFPGGNNLQGHEMDSRWRWNETIGDLIDRPGRTGAWEYFNTDGLGLIEYMLLCEDLGVEPILIVWAGLYLKGIVIPEEDLDFYIQDALDEIEFLTGDASTEFGAKRAALGYEPFKLKFVGVGNEDHFSAGLDSYNAYRFRLFHSAIRETYPDLIILSSTVELDPIPDHTSLDYHDYGNPDGAVRNFTLFDNQSTEHKVLVGEYGVARDNGNEKLWSNHRPRPWWIASVAEAIFYLGTERNPQKVYGTAFAPLLQNINKFQWNPNMITFNANTSATVRSTSFQVMELFSNNRFTKLLPDDSSDQYGPGYWVAGLDESNETYIWKGAVYNTTEAVDFNVAFPHIRGSAKADLTVLTAPDAFSQNYFDKDNVVERSDIQLEAGPKGFNFQLPQWSVAILRSKLNG